MAGPADGIATGEGRRDVRASNADREQVAGALRAALVQGRLTEDELGERVDRVYAARTYAELAEVIADIPTALTGAKPARSPWRATKIAWRFEYAAFLPGIVAVILLPGGPRTTILTFILLAAVTYLIFWTIGLLIMVSSRRVKPPAEQQLPPLCYADRQQVIHTLRAALAQGRLTDDEHDARAAQASTAQSRAELATLTADLPPGLTARLPRASDGWTGACVSIAAALVVTSILLWQPDNAPAFMAFLLAAATVILAPPITVGLMVDARHQKRSGGQLRLGPAPRAGA